MTLPDGSLGDVLRAHSEGIRALDRAMPSYVWATVVSVDPIMIHLDEDSAPLPDSPDSLVNVNVGDRVMCLIAARTFIILANYTTRPPSAGVRINAGTGLTGGGDLTADRTISANFGTTAGTIAQGNDSRIVNAVPTSRGVLSGFGLTGGGNFTTTRTLTIDDGFTPQTYIALGTQNLNTIDTPGFYAQAASANATSARNYPSTAAGTMAVMARSGTDVTQFYTNHNSGSMYWRGRYQGTWAAWKTVLDDTSLRIAAGSVSITPVANQVASRTVSFPSGRFSGTPYVVATANTSVPGSALLEVSVGSISSSGCTIYLYRTNTTATGVNWIAMQ